VNSKSRIVNLSTACSRKRSNIFIYFLDKDTLLPMGRAAKNILNFNSMQVRDWDLGDGGEGRNKDKRYLIFTLAAVEEGMQSSSKRYKVQATEMTVQWIQCDRPKYNEPQTTMKLHAFKSSLVIVCPQKVEGACETLSTQLPPSPPIELYPALVSPVFLHMLFVPTWFCIKPCSTVLHVFLILQENLAMFFKFKFNFVHGSII